MGPAMYEARRPFIERALAGESLAYEADFPRSEGTVQTEVVHVPHRDQAGRTLGLYTVVMDITARKLAERVLSESEERFRSIADSAPVPMWVSRLDGLRQFVNRAYHEFLGVPFADALNFDWRKALHPDDLERILREQRAGEGSRKPFVLEARYRRHDGQWRWLRSESQPRWGPAGEHIGFIGVAHDITASKEAERALTELNETLERRIEDRTRQLAASEALIQTFFNHSSECYAVIVEEDDGHFRYAEVNPATLRLYKKTRDAVVGRTIQEVLGPESASEIGAHLAACLREGAPRRYERTQGDAVIEAIVTPAPQEPGSPRRVVVSAHDVTERRRLEQQLHQSQKMEAVGQLTGGVAHDFNNLLTLVIGGLDIIGRQIPNLPDPVALTRVERGREMAMQGAQRAASLTTRLLAFSRQQPLNPQALDANKLVVDVCDLLRRAIGETIAVETALGNDLWRMYADANQLENALLNIGFNARDAMPNGGKLIIETANASLDKAYTSSLNEEIAPGEFVMIAITDTGTGMDMTTRERAFDPFFTTKEVGKGTGLGLSQVYGFARQSAGHVKIYSEIGEGTTVKIYLPRSVSDRKNPIVGEANKLSRWTGAETILVVEDDDELRKYAKGVLEELGYHVMSAGSGAAALETLNGSDQIDLLLTDVVMPGGMNGRQLADKAVEPSTGPPRALHDRLHPQRDPPSGPSGSRNKSDQQAIFIRRARFQSSPGPGRCRLSSRMMSRVARLDQLRVSILPSMRIQEGTGCAPLNQATNAGKAEPSAQAPSQQSKLTFSFICKPLQVSAIELARSPAAFKAKEDGRRPPDFRHVAIGRAVRDDMPKRREIKVHSGDTELLAGNEFEHLFPLFCCGGWIRVVGDARVGVGELHARKMDDVAPDEKLVAAGVDEPCRVARSMAGCGEGADAGGDLVGFHRTNAIAIGAQRDASEVKIALALRWHTRHRPVVCPVGKLVLMQNELCVREYGLAGCVGEPRLVIAHAYASSQSCRCRQARHSWLSGSPRGVRHAPSLGRIPRPQARSGRRCGSQSS